MSEPIYQGYTPPEVKYCIRCGGINDDILYQLCWVCRAGDTLAKWIDEHCAKDELARDEAYTNEINRPI